MKRQAKTRAWHHQHAHDFYVRKSVEQGYRSRAAYKLMEIDDTDHLLKPGGVVVDLGCAPGGWCQVAAERMQGRGRIVGLDLLEMTGLNHVDFIQGDFTADAPLEELEALLAGQRVDLVMSDMAPNITGVAVSDQARAYHLAELALEFAEKWLKPGGAFLVKVFQGAGFEDYVRRMRVVFQGVVVRKPDASRDRSREVYLLGRGLRMAAVVSAGGD
ncbi:MAG: 23S rRNA (uridine2552-2'-O)-methyltransferase [bacterium]|nr:MAG: 23S rRNA (uridine2552-2'-O)-methyltransferase [bacterium]KAF0150773.1 MAG: 23S rRNA (uridine2552-2'-O)-methyltransferase [bacterium]KAF0165491.1 MAG: 23S rRNA (uridine2552-2'-O)-methyltransferase [bacterium]TXT18432.1 MAG: 23S rRNA (uridine2552-2'-O)-methyltransferase [bacterium]